MNLKFSPNICTIRCILLSLILTACGSGSSGNSFNNIPSPNNNSLNITQIATLSLIAGTTYSPYCIYNYGGSIFIINGNGSGTGISLNAVNGQTINVSGLPLINAASGDICLPNYGQLNWYNINNPYLINVFDPDSNTTKLIDLSQTGISASVLDTTSYDYNALTNQLYANSSFQNNDYARFSRFNLNDSPLNNYVNLPDTAYPYSVNPAVFGFWSQGGSSFTQLYPVDTANNLPAALVTVTSVGGGNPEQQSVKTVVDIKGQAIPAMSIAWDLAATSQGIIVTTGAVQPILYNCPAANGKFVCNKTYSDPALTSQYRIMRLLGANSNTLYFLGINLAQATLAIFSMPI